MPFCLECGSSAEYKIPEGDNRQRIVCNHCGYIHYDNPKIVCGALVVHDNKILMCRRAIQPQYGMWTLPAGFMEIGETMKEGAMRETLEEADAIASNMKLYCLFDIPVLGQLHVMYLANLAKASDGKLFGVGSESLECGLFSEDEIDWSDIAFESVKRTLMHYFHDRKQHSDFVSFPLHEEEIEKKKEWDI